MAVSWVGPCTALQRMNIPSLGGRSCTSPAPQPALPITGAPTAAAAACSVGVGRLSQMNSFDLNWLMADGDGTGGSGAGGSGSGSSSGADLSALPGAGSGRCQGPEGGDCEEMQGALNLVCVRAQPRPCTTAWVAAECAAPTAIHPFHLCCLPPCAAVVDSEGPARSAQQQAQPTAQHAVQPAQLKPVSPETPVAVGLRSLPQQKLTQPQQPLQQEPQQQLESAATRRALKRRASAADLVVGSAPPPLQLPAMQPLMVRSTTVAPAPPQTVPLTHQSVEAARCAAAAAQQQHLKVAFGPAAAAWGNGSGDKHARGSTPAQSYAAQYQAAAAHAARALALQQQMQMQQAVLARFRGGGRQGAGGSNGSGAQQCNSSMLEQYSSNQLSAAAAATSAAATKASYAQLLALCEQRLQEGGAGSCSASAAPTPPPTPAAAVLAAAPGSPGGSCCPHGSATLSSQYALQAALGSMAGGSGLSAFGAQSTPGTGGLTMQVHPLAIVLPAFFQSAWLGLLGLPVSCMLESTCARAT